jgi:acyl-CoA oxidase
VVKQSLAELALVLDVFRYITVLCLDVSRYAMSFAANKLKMIYSYRTKAEAKTIHVLSSGLKALHTWHNMRTAQV